MVTMWSNHSDIELYKSFKSQIWDGLPVGSRRELLQEVENRTSLSRGANPRTLRFEDIEGRTLGYQIGNSIAINNNIVENGALRVEYENKLTGEKNERLIDYPASNWHLLDTVFHESTHGQQEDENRGQSTKSYIDGEGNGKNPNNIDYMLYRLGIDEMEAFNNGQTKTLAAIDYVLTYGNIEEVDPTMDMYVKSQMNDTVDVYVDEAKNMFNDEDIIDHIKAWTEDMENDRAHSEVHTIINVLDHEMEIQNQRKYQNQNSSYFNPLGGNDYENDSQSEDNSEDQPNSIGSRVLRPVSNGLRRR